MLTIENLTKSYPGGVTAVKDVCLTVENGDLYGFIGHNGAGKTTTIKSVVGLLPFEKGKITIDGVSVTQDPIRCKSMIAYIPDTPELYDNLTGMQYLNFVSDIYGISKRERSSKINQYATMLEMTDSLNDSVSSYSHGMKQKLSFIAAFVHTPKLLILDEPFVGLDPRAAFSVKTVMKEFCEKGNAIFFSTHVLEVAEKICNKIAIIKNGRLIASGETRTVKGDLSLEEVFLELTEEEKGEA
ncbi:MAG: ABC transporter ATP-binding protein [Clostridiaceae bacterium]|nr:ABC transporter ATP-binding protein [Clostridiaceae bacterium]